MQAPKVAQTFGTGPHDEGARAELLGKIKAVITGVGFGEGGKEPACLPVEGTAVDEYATDGNAVSAEELGGRVHDEIGAVIERA